MAQTPKTNAHLTRVIHELRELSRENQVAVWRDVADRLARSRRNWPEVNLSRVNRNAAKGEQVVVPGVLLATAVFRFPLATIAFAMRTPRTWSRASWRPRRGS